MGVCGSGWDLALYGWGVWRERSSWVVKDLASLKPWIRIGFRWIRILNLILSPWRSESRNPHQCGSGYLSSYKRHKKLSYEGTKVFLKGKKPGFFVNYGQFPSSWNRIRIRITNTDPGQHTLNMKLDLQSLFGLHEHSCTHWLRPINIPTPPHLGSYTRALLVSLGRRHLIATSCKTAKWCGSGSTTLLECVLQSTCYILLAWDRLPPSVQAYIMLE